MYKFKNANGEIIYVGKAKSLRSRVTSYFKAGIDSRSKTYQLVQNIFDIDFIEVKSELEALILEADLIKKFMPKYNINLKDDKSYLYIVIRNEAISNSKKLKKIILARRTDLNSTDEYYGPFLNSDSAKIVYRNLRKIIPFRDCSTSKFKKYQGLQQPCLYGHLGLCSAPCTEAISESNYKKDILKLKRLLTGKNNAVSKLLKIQMQKASENQEFEKAGKFRDLLNKFDYISRNRRSLKDYIENPYLIEDLQQKSLLELKRNIPILKKIPSRIECYDISNLSGKQATAALITSVDGKLENKFYKRFKIKSKDTPDDFAMLYEVLDRRLKRNLALNTPESWELPDLFVIDGGKGQVSKVLEVMEKFSCEIPVIGLAKRNETIVYFFKNEFHEVNLPKDNEGLKLLQRMRDEAHRFSRKYHHFLRMKSLDI